MSRATLLLPALVSACVAMPVALTAPESNPAVGPSAAGAACPRTARESADAQVLLSLINAEREGMGLNPVALSAPLSATARRHACDNAARQTTSHQGSDGSNLALRLRRDGITFRLAAENTGLGFANPQIALRWWMASAPHRANILHPEVTLVGLGKAEGLPRPAWVLDFIAPD